MLDKYLKVTQKDKLTYIDQMTDFYPKLGPEMNKYYDKAFKFWDDLGIQEDSQWRMDLEYSRILYNQPLSTDDSYDDFCRDLENLIEKVSKFTSEYSK